MRSSFPSVFSGRNTDPFTDPKIINMNPAASLTQRKRVAGFAIAFVATASLLAFIINFAWHDAGANEPNVKGYASTMSKSSSRDLETIGIISSRFNVLKQLDNEYGRALTLADSGYMVNINRQIAEQERALRISVDSLANFRVPQPDSTVNKLITQTVSGYSAALASRNVMNNLRAVIEREDR